MHAEAHVELAPVTSRALPVARRTAVLAVLLLGALVTTLNMSVTNVALPSIAADLNATGVQIHWIGDGFTIALTSLVLLAGAVGDRYGRRLLFLLGAGLSVPTAVMSALSSSPGQLIGWRMAAGFAAALLFPTTLSLITSLYTDKEERVRAIATWTGVSAAGAALGPPVAGFLLGSFSWASVYFVSVPLAGAALIAGWFLLPSISHEGAPPVDWLGGVLTIVFVGTLLYGIIELPVIGFSGEVLLYFAISALALALFILRQLRVRFPLLDLRVFRDMRFTTASITVTMLSFGLAGVMYLASQYLQNVLGYEPMNAGLAVMPVALMALVTSPISARLNGKLGSKIVIIGGLLTLAAGFGLASLWTPESTYGFVGISFILMGSGVGLAMTPSTNAIMSSLPEEKAGVGSAMNDVTRDFGTAVGIALFGAVVSVTYNKVIQDVYTSLPEDQRARVSEDLLRTASGSLSGALEIAQRYPGANADAFVRVARTAFLDGQGTAMAIGAGVCVATALLVAWLYPSGTSQDDSTEAS